MPNIIAHKFAALQQLPPINNSKTFFDNKQTIQCNKILSNLN